MGLIESIGNEVTILIAEDNRDDRWFLEHAFSKEAPAISLQFVQNGKDVLNYLQGNKPFAVRKQYPLPRLLILDLKMPVMDGFEVLNWVRTDCRFSSLPTVVLSSSNHPADIERARGLGANAYHVKPNDLFALRGLVEGLTCYWCAQPA